MGTRFRAGAASLFHTQQSILSPLRLPQSPEPPAARRRSKTGRRPVPESMGWGGEREREKRKREQGGWASECVRTGRWPASIPSSRRFRRARCQRRRRAAPARAVVPPPKRRFPGTQSFNQSNQEVPIPCHSTTIRHRLTPASAAPGRPRTPVPPVRRRRQPAGQINPTKPNPAGPVNGAAITPSPTKDLYQ